MNETEIRYVLDGRTVTVPIDPAMPDEDVWEVARRVGGDIYRRAVTPWQVDDPGFVGPRPFREEGSPS